MADAEAASQAARDLAHARWGNRVAVRAAQTVIERAAELPPEVLREVRAATRPGCLRVAGQQKETR